jgi:murein hydrolase activator
MRSFLISPLPTRLWSKSLLVIFFLFPLFVSAQTRAELEKRRRQHEQEIRLTRQLLQETQKKEKATLSQLEALSRQISTRSRLINTIGEELELIDLRIEELTLSVAQLQKDLSLLKDQYARIVKAAYKQRNTYDKLMYILASRTFDQAVKRLKYLQQFSDYRQKQAHLILSTQRILNENLAELRTIKSEKEMLLVEKESEKHELEQDKKEEGKVLATLQKKEKELRKQLQAKEAAARKLKKAIEDLIEKEIAAARKRAEEEARKAAPGRAPAKPSRTELSMTPEAVALANDFNRNKGTLPWPVEQGYISKSYGVHPHPTLKNITVNNTGIDITTNKDAKARVIFRGEVKMKFFVPGMGYAVIVSHGDYYTVYTNLDEVFVKTGDKVNTKQEIGTVMVNTVEEKTELHIEIYKGKLRLDPEDWLFKK